MLLPYLDQAPLYNRIDFNRTFCYTSDVVRMANGARLSVLRCPSDIEHGRPDPVFPNNYCLSTGPNSGWTFDANDAVGVMHVRISRTIRDVTDGTSNTILAGEVLLPDGDSSSGPAGYTLGDVIRGIPLPSGYRKVKPTVANLRAYDQACRTSFGYGNHYGGNGNWTRPMPLHTIFNTVTPPNPVFANCDDFAAWGDTDGNGVFPSRSRHIGGAHHLLCDGAVRFVSDSTDHDLYQNLGTIAGGEVPGEF